jgi:dolichol-phosphate mannosyltransferase
MRETNTNAFGLVHWMGFRVSTIEYVQAPRLHGTSNWTLSDKLNLLASTVIGFSRLPVRSIAAAGFLVFLLGIVAAVYALWYFSGGATRMHWVIVLAVVLLLSGMQMVMLGILGEYIWRILDDTRGRPQYLIEETAGAPDDPYFGNSIR